MRVFFVWPFLMLLGFSCWWSPQMRQSAGWVQESQQMVVVVSPNEQSITGTLYRYERGMDQSWHLVGEPYPITLGRTGLAWGQGVHYGPLAQGYQKKEGDGKSPAGIFRFGTAFGYAEAAPAGLRLPYVHVSEAIQCIEDPNSAYYNQIVDNRVVESDWQAADFMRRQDDLYKWGIFVAHNTPAVAGGGSCIFFHLWGGPDRHTAGCTGMTEERMLELMLWLDPAKLPLLVQLTQAEYARWQPLYQLPVLP